MWATRACVGQEYRLRKSRYPGPASLLGLPGKPARWARQALLASRPRARQAASLKRWVCLDSLGSPEWGPLCNVRSMALVFLGWRHGVD
eukprot:gene9936-biopygen12785